MINLRVLVPDSTINYVKNPTFRYDTVGWTAFGSTLTRSMDYARFGIASGKVVTNGAALNEGVYYRVNELQGVSGNVTVSCYVRGAGAKVRVKLRDGGGNTWVSDPFALDDRWNRLEVTGLVTGTNDVRLYIELAETAAKVATFYVDGAQVEVKAYSTTYCDGDQEGCQWNGSFSASKSTRPGSTRKGGRWVPVAGPCRVDTDVYATVLTGFGMAPISNVVQEWATEAGGFYQSTKVNNKPVIITFHTKQDEPSNPPENYTLAPLHGLRQQLIDLFKPDKTVGGEPFLFEYSDTEADRPLYMWLRYETGLTGEWDIRNAYSNSFAVRMLAVDPAFYEDNQDVQQLTWEQTFSTPPYRPVWKKGIDGKWVSLFQQTVSIDAFTPVVFSPDRTMYFGGSQSGHGIFKWDGDSLTKIANLNAAAQALEFGLDGMLYVGGGFTTVNGVARSYIAKYDPSTGTWSSLSTGADNSVRTICAAPNGQLYIGGGFSTLGGVTCRYIGRWDGTQFRTVGATSGVSQSVNKIIRGIDSDTLLVAGGFLTSYGGSVTYNGVCAIDTTTNLLSPLGAGISGDVSGAYGVLALAQGTDGVIYASATYNSGGANSKILKYQGGIWASILTEMNLSATNVFVDNKGILYVSGSFSSTSAGSFAGIAVYSGGSWQGFDISFNTVFGISLSPENELVVSVLGNNGSVLQKFYTPGYNTIVNNGSMGTYPLMYFKGSCTIRYIENLKTRQAIYLDLPIYSNEEVEFDFARGKITSSVRGSVLYGLLPGSEIRGIYLLPGENEIAVMVDNEVSPQCQLRWTLKHWSGDAIKIVSPL